MKKKILLLLLLFLLVVFLFCFSCIEVNAISQTIKDFQPWTDNTNTGQYGMQFRLIIENITLRTVTFATGQTGTFACLYLYSPWTNITCKPINSSNMVVFNYGLTNNTKYVIWVNKEGAIQSTKYNTTASYPLYPTEALKYLKWEMGLNLGIIYPVTTFGSNISTFWLGHISYDVDVCNSVFANTSKTEWFNMSACNILDIILQNRSYITYDSTCGYPNITTYEYANNSCSYCGSSIDTMNLSICNKNFNTYINLSESEKKMIEYALFFIIFILLGVFVNSLFIALSGVPLLLISTTYLYNAVSKLDLALFWVFLVLGFFFIILGVTIFIINGQKDIKNKENGDFKYKDY